MKMRQLKRLLSVTLASAMLLTSVPMGTVASDGGSVSDVQETTAAPETDASKAADETQDTQDVPLSEAAQQEDGQSEGSTQPAAAESESAGVSETAKEERETAKVEQETVEQETAEADPSQETTDAAQPEVSETPETEDPRKVAAVSESAGAAVETIDSETGNSDTESSETSSPSTDETSASDTESSEANVVEVTWTLDGEWNPETGEDGANEFEWNAEVREIKAEVKGVTLSQGLEWTIQGPDGAVEVKEPGEYTVTATAKQPDELQGKTLGESATIKFTIVPAKVAVTWEEGKDSITYTGNVIGEDDLPTATFARLAEDSGANTAKVSLKEGTATEIKDAGTYTLVASIEDEAVAKHYKLTGAEKQFEVTQKEVTISTWNLADLTYNGEEQDVEAPTVDGEYPGELTISYQGAALNGSRPKYVGSYTATVELSDGNYKLSDNSVKTANFEVTKRAVTVTPKAQKIVYGAATPTSFDYDVIVEEMGPETVKKELNAEVKDAGFSIQDYPAEGRGDAKTYTISGTHVFRNYDVTYNSANFEVVQLPITITVDDSSLSMTYGSEVPTLKYTIAPSDVESAVNGPKTALTQDEIVAELKEKGEVEEILSWTKDGVDPKNPAKGSYPVELTFEKTKAANFLITVEPANFIVGEKEITVEWTDEVVIYNGLPQSVKDPTTNGYSAGFTVTYKDAAGGTVANPTDAGVYTASVTFNDDENYAFTGSFEVDLTIKKRDITVAADSKKIVYGADIPSLTYRVTAGADDVLSEDLIKRELGDEIFEVQDYEAKKRAVGTYQIVSAGKPFQNYNVTYVPSTLTVHKLPISIVVTSDLQMTYGDPLPTPEVEYGITKARVTEAVDRPESLLEQDAIVAELKEKSGLTDKDILSWTENISNPSKPPVGEYPIKLLVDQEKATNFEIAYTEEDVFKVLKKGLQFAWEGKTVTYNGKEQSMGGPSAGGYDGKYTITYTDDATGEVVSAPKNVGTYTATAQIDDNHESLDGSVLEVQLIIQECNVTVTPHPQEMLYGADIPNLTYDVAVPGNEMEADTVRAELEETKAQANLSVPNYGAGNVAAYDIKGEDIFENYNVTYDAAKLTVKPLEVTVSLENKEKLYSQPDPSTEDYTVAITGDAAEEAKKTKKTPEDVKVELGTEVLEVAYPEGLTAETAPTDTYKYKLQDLNENAGAKNYIVKYDEKATLTVSKLPITITVPDANDNLRMTYGETVKPLAYDITVDNQASEIVQDRIVSELKAEFELGEKDILSWTEGLDDPKKPSVGKYPVRLVQPILAGAEAVTETGVLTKNFAISYAGATFAVEELEVLVRPNHQEKYYLEADPALTYSVTIEGNTALEQATVKSELDDMGAFVSRKEGELAADYEQSVLFQATEEDQAPTQPENYGNYQLRYETATFTIKKLPVTIQAPALSKYYGKVQDPDLESRENGFSIFVPAPAQGESSPNPIWKDADGNASDAIAVVSQELKKEYGVDRLLKRAAGEAAGTYPVTLNVPLKQNESANFAITYVGAEFTILKLPVTVMAAAGQNKFYKEKDPAVFAYTATFGKKRADAAITAADTDIPETDLKAKIEGELRTTGVLKRAAGEVVGTYAYDLTDVAKNAANFALTYAGDATFAIKKLPIEIRPNEGQGKYYGKNEDPDFAYTVTITEKNLNLVDAWKSAKANDIQNDIIKELGEDANVKLGEAVLQREEGKEAGTYKFSLTFDAQQAANYAITFVEGVVFTIHRLPVVLRPDLGQSKMYSYAEPDFYKYEAEIQVKETDLTARKVRSILGDYILERDAGEAVGFYGYRLQYGDEFYPNYDLTVVDWIDFEIEPLQIEATDEPLTITTQDTSFVVRTNIDPNAAREKSAPIDIKITPKFPKSGEKDGIEFQDGNWDWVVDEYVKGANSGRLKNLFVNSQEQVVTLLEADYSKAFDGESEKGIRNGKGDVTWKGYLPAGTELKLELVDRQGDSVSDTTLTVKVVAVDVNLSWGKLQVNSDNKQFITVNDGKANLSLTSQIVAQKESEEAQSETGDAQEPQSEGTGEVQVQAGANQAFDGLLAITYQKGENAAKKLLVQKAGKAIKAEPHNVGSTHALQTMTVNVVDTLNFKTDAQTIQFYVDDLAFPIGADAIKFENRGQEISINLPEYGKVSSVEIPNATVEVTGQMGQQAVLPVTWSGENLIPSGSAITVTYTDEAGHTATGNATAARSAVNTPIAFSIRPELNQNGYLDGSNRPTALIVSGTACACEEIEVTVAGVTQKAFATKKETWSDSNGSWELKFDLAGLPEGEDFTISAQYVDVTGTGHTITAKYDAFCASPALLSPIYEAMEYIGGMAEPNTTVGILVNKGETSDAYELQVDRFGHFTMTDVPLMIGGEHSFDIVVTDIAGNRQSRHYEIPEPEDPSEVTSTVHPLGKIFYSAEAEDSVTYVATPVSLSDFGEKEDAITLPLLMGMSYEVGTFTVQKTKNGVSVSSQLELPEDILEEDYRIENEKLYVYDSTPTLDDLKNKTGKAYAYGEEIPLSEDGTIWVVDEKDLTIWTEYITEFDVFEFLDSKEHGKWYEAYQER